MDPFEHSLRAMKRLLDAVGEKHWAGWIQEDLRRWQAGSDTSHHLSAYGGMGSFNDVLICGTNQHRVTAAQEAWANPLFEWLKSLCFYLAHHPTEKVTAAGLARAVGRHDAPLAAFVGGDKAPASMRGRVSDVKELQGWRCLACGHAEVSTQDVEYALAQALIPGLVFQGCQTRTLSQLVDRVLKQEVPGADEARGEVLSAIAASGIKVAEREGWMRPCPSCRCENTAVYRWKLAPGSSARFVPAEDNLAMRG
jgi:hypothetical protein